MQLSGIALMAFIVAVYLRSVENKVYLQRVTSDRGLTTKLQAQDREKNVIIHITVDEQQEANFDKKSDAYKEAIRNMENLLYKQLGNMQEFEKVKIQIFRGAINREGTNFPQTFNNINRDNLPALIFVTDKNRSNPMFGYDEAEIVKEIKAHYGIAP